MVYVFEIVLILSITFFATFWAFGYYFADQYGETLPDTVKKNISVKFVQNLVHTSKMTHGEIVEHRDFEKTKQFYEHSRDERLQILQNLYHGRTEKEAKWSDLYNAIVPEVLCDSLVRMGPVGDGGKWMCRPWALPKHCVLFSFGVYEELVFEKDLQNSTNASCDLFIYGEKPLKDSRALHGIDRLNIHYKEIQLRDSREGNAFNLTKELSEFRTKAIEVVKLKVSEDTLPVLQELLNGTTMCQLLLEIEGTTEQMLSILDEVGHSRYRLFSHQFNPRGTNRGDFSLIHDDCLARYHVEPLANYLMDTHL